MAFSATRTLTKTKKKFDKNRFIFYWSMLLLPLLQFIIFYIVVNFNSFLMAFQEYNTYTFKATFSLSNFGYWLSEKQLPTLWICLKNSLLYFAITLLTVPLSLLISYYVYKKFRFHEFFKIIAFIPSIISISAVAIMYKMFVNHGLKFLFESAPISSEYSAARQPMLIVFYLLLNMSGNLLIYINAMSQVPDSIVEAAKIDGAGEFRIFIHVIVPQIWGTVVSLFVIFMAGIVTNQGYLFNFFGNFAATDLYTLGYFMFRNIQEGVAPSVEAAYYQTSSLGLMLTLILAPLTIFARKFLLRIGPRED